MAEDQDEPISEKRIKISYLTQLMIEAENASRTHIFFKPVVADRKTEYRDTDAAFGGLSLKGEATTKPARTSNGNIDEFWAPVIGLFTQNLVNFRYAHQHIDDKAISGYAIVHATGIIPRLRKDVCSVLESLGYEHQKRKK